MPFKFAIAAALALAGVSIPTVAPAQSYGRAHYDHRFDHRHGYADRHDRRAYRERQRWERRHLRDGRRYHHDGRGYYGR